MSKHQPNEASFLKDVASHVMTIHQDDGNYRHLAFSQPKTCNQHFAITTWPGYLCISGDMGCYVFARTSDMMMFFRDQTPAGKTLSINPGYWGEKIQAIAKNGPIKEYSADTFQAAIKRCLDDRDSSKGLRKAVKEEVLSRADDGEHEAIRAAMDFEYEGSLPFVDFWEYSVREFSYQFLWCCYAIAWAVRQYDATIRHPIPARRSKRDE